MLAGAMAPWMAACREQHTAAQKAIGCDMVVINEAAPGLGAVKG